MKGNKTNKTMRVAGGLLIATLLSTSIVSGTFAKYVTTGSASDSARVAKFGVVVKAEGTLFSTTYLSKSGGNTPGGEETTGLTVKSSDTKKVVAPGTKSDSTGLSFGVTGTPEVDVAISFSVNEGASDVWLSTGTYADMTTNKRTASDVFTTSSTYYPIVYTMTYKASDGTTKTVKGSLDKVVSDLNTSFKNTTYKANTDLSTTEISSFNLTWEWAFETEGENSGTTMNRADTLLGDLAADAGADNGIVGTAISDINTNAKKTVLSKVTAGSGLKPGDSDTNTYNLNTNFGFSITVTQVD